MKNEFSKLGYETNIDNDIPHILSIDSSIDLHENDLVVNGNCFIQDKASCFPPYILYSALNKSCDIIDACAAPGNKTSYIANLIGKRYLFY